MQFLQPHTFKKVPGSVKHKIIANSAASPNARFQPWKFARLLFSFLLCLVKLCRRLLSLCTRWTSLLNKARLALSFSNMWKAYGLSSIQSGSAMKAYLDPEPSVTARHVALPSSEETAWNRSRSDYRVFLQPVHYSKVLPKSKNKAPITFSKCLKMSLCVYKKGAESPFQWKRCCIMYSTLFEKCTACVYLLITLFRIHDIKQEEECW